MRTFTFTFFIIGLIIGYANALYDSPLVLFWNNYYYVWDKLKDVFLLVCLYQVLNNKLWKKATLAIIAFMCVRVVYQILDGFGVFDMWRELSVTIMFFLLIIIGGYIVALPNLKKWHK